MKRIVEKTETKLRQFILSPKIWLTHLFSAEEPYCYIFHHIPKCGGNSAVQALTNWFLLVKDYPRSWSNIDNSNLYKRYCDNPKDLDKLKYYHLLTGHYHLENSFLHQRYPLCLTDKRYRLFTFLRDPLELQLSLYIL